VPAAVCWAHHLHQLFEIPSQYVVRVPIRHPTNDAISALGLQWYAVPAVSNMELSVGGITYTAAPFNGETVPLKESDFAVVQHHGL